MLCHKKRHENHGKLAILFALLPFLPKREARHGGFQFAFSTSKVIWNCWPFSVRYKSHTSWKKKKKKTWSHFESRTLTIFLGMFPSFFNSCSFQMFNTSVTNMLVVILSRSLRYIHLRSTTYICCLNFIYIQICKQL